MIHRLASELDHHLKLLSNDEVETNIGYDKVSRSTYITISD